MAEAAMEMALDILVSDVSGQKKRTVKSPRLEGTVGDLVRGLTEKMGLPANDTEGRPLSYRARLEREGRHLGGGERLDEALKPGDRLTLQPDIDAGEA
jgi:hypothetical protein